MPECFVLLVDDEVDFVSVLAERLEARGLKVDTAGDGETALVKAREQAFDAILLDMAMPGMDGIQTLNGLLAINPDLQVILLTGQATLRQAVEAMKLGALDLLEKPVEIAVAFPEHLHTISGTLELYRLDHGAWITEGITGTHWGSNYMNAYVRYPGVYAVLGRTNRLFLPLVVR